MTLNDYQKAAERTSGDLTSWDMVQIQARKVPSIVHVDDRTICFDGRANNLYEQIINFKPWYERESESENQ